MAPVKPVEAPQSYFILLTVLMRYFWFGSLCLLVLVSVSVLFSPSVCLYDI